MIPESIICRGYSHNNVVCMSLTRVYCDKTTGDGITAKYSRAFSIVNVRGIFVNEDNDRRVKTRLDMLTTLSSSGRIKKVGLFANFSVMAWMAWIFNIKFHSCL